MPSAIVLGLLVLAVSVPARAAVPLTPVSEGTESRGSPWSFWDSADAGNPGRIDHSTWQIILNRYLDSTHPSGINRFRYADVTPEHRALLSDYVSRLASLDPRRYGKAEQKAYWINLYNAQTVLVVLGEPDVESIRDIKPTWFSRGPWQQKSLRIGGEGVSLDDIEHRILRPLFGDRRIHYALNCASLGCPDLSPKAYTADDVEMLLAHAERAFINDGRAVRIEGDTLMLSSIYDWYRKDFADSERDLLEYLAKHHTGLAERLRDWSGPVRYDYDWSLNRP